MRSARRLSLLALSSSGLRGSFASLLATLALVAACGGGSQASTGGAGGAAGAGGSQGGAGGAGTGGDLLLGGFGGSGGEGGASFEACATSAEDATLIPVTMFITVDRSGSMSNDNKWNNAENAFFAFFQDPEAQTLNVALRFWPEDSCNGDQCNVQECGTPHVDVGSLADPAHVQALQQAFQDRSPNGNTPMSAALEGATSWAANHQTAVENGERTVVILLTDGEPNGCDENVSNIASIAGDAFTTSEIPTFAVGLQGSNENTLDQIALAGGTTEGFFIGNGNAAADLLAALKQIQKNTVACVYALPEAAGPEPLDPALVNVTYVPSDGTPSETIGQVASEADCAGGGGWYYDDPINPAIIELCPLTCTAIQADEGAKVQLVFGCETKPA
jgi:hypothetical protein